MPFDGMAAKQRRKSLKTLPFCFWGSGMQAPPACASQRKRVEPGTKLRLTVFRKEIAMPTGSSPKREHEYKELESKFKKEHRYPGREEEVAARIVNKQRAEHGETKSSKSK
jgi:hypothetical protein